MQRQCRHQKRLSVDTFDQIFCDSPKNRINKPIRHDAESCRRARRHARALSIHHRNERVQEGVQDAIVVILPIPMASHSTDTEPTLMSSPAQLDSPHFWTGAHNIPRPRLEKSQYLHKASRTSILPLVIQQAYPVSCSVRRGRCQQCADREAVERTSSARRST